MNITKLLILTLGLCSLSACSTQYRDALPQISEEELNDVFAEIADNTGDSVVAALSQRTNMVGDKSTVMYHAKEEGGRPAASVLSVEDMSFFGWDIDAPSYAVLSIIDVIFVDSANDNGERIFSLLLRMEGDTQDGLPVYFASSSQPGDYGFSENEFEVKIQAANGESLLLRSRDLSGKYADELGGSIKLDIYIDDGSADGVYLGQISTLSGYGNR